MSASTGERTSDTDCRDGALAYGVPLAGGVLAVALCLQMRPDALLQDRVTDLPSGSAVIVCEGLTVGRDDHLVPSVLAEVPDRKALTEDRRLPMPRRQAQDEPRGLLGCYGLREALQAPADVRMDPAGLVVGVRPSGEVEEVALRLDTSRLLDSLAALFVGEGGPGDGVR